MPGRVITYILLTLIVICAAFILAGWGHVRFQGNNQGYQPTQPIAYSHRLHAGELQIPCLYCHFGAEKSRHAGVPSASVCMNCHSFVRATSDQSAAEADAAKTEGRDAKVVTSPELRKLYDYLGLDENLQPDPSKTPKSIDWIRVHKLPDYVYFNHSAHVDEGVTCQKCHGPVQDWDKMRQFKTLTMGWCVNCHRDVKNASIDCDTCHY